jgi:hypothetical protein
LRAAIDSSLSRQGEILDVLGEAFGRYPFSTVGAIVDNQDDLFFAPGNADPSGLLEVLLA